MIAPVQRPSFFLRIVLSLACALAVLAGAVLLVPDRAPAPASTLPDGVDEDWWSRASAHLQEREYYASPTAEGWQAPNRCQDLRTRFRPEGVEVTPRGSVPAWSWGWSLTAWGRDGHMIAAAPTAPTADRSRVEYVRDGLIEWYENRESGLEQGFLVASRPPGEGELRLTGRVGGDLTARSDGQGLRFTDRDGHAVLDYDELHVWDATGRELPADMDLQGDQLCLHIDDAEASYPVTVDPIVSTPSWSEEGDKFEAEFGWTVATAGDVNGDGYSDIIVGSPYYSETGFLITGKAWVYLGSATGLRSTPVWEGLGPDDECRYGWSVACAGDVNGDGYDDIIVGAPYYTDGIYADGMAYVYEGSVGGPHTLPDWSGNTNNHGTSTRFGWTVGCAGDVNGDGYDDILVSDPQTGGMGTDGRLSVWHGSSSGLGYSSSWTVTGGASSWLGNSACTAGDINGDGYSDIVAGAYMYESGDWEEGAIEVFLGSSSGLSPSYDQRIQSNIDYMHMGSRVTLAGDIDGDGYGDVLVGCSGDPTYCAEEPEVRLYRGTATGLETTAAWSWGGHLDDPAITYNIACAGDVNGDGYSDILLGYDNYELGQANEGQIMLFYGNFDGLATTYAWMAQGDQVDARMGPCATGGDVNGDGYSDVIGGLPYYDGTSTDRGMVRCWHGGSRGIRYAAGWVTESNQDWARFGWSLATAGDANGDGYDDLLVGSPYYDNGENDEGAVFLYLGSNTGLTWLPLWWAESNQAGAQFGRSVASAGDVNGDGLPDLLVGAPGYSSDGTSDGTAFLWFGVLGGGPYGNPSNADWQYHAGIGDADLGFSVACAGDVNADGFADIVIGAPEYDNGHIDEGAAFVFHGSSSGPSATHDWFRDTGKAYSDYGFSVASAGDFNGDGYDDIIVGAPEYDHPSDREGLAFVYHGSSSGLTTGAPWWYAQSDQIGAEMGFSVACAGDVNGDGFSDVIVGAPYWDTTRTNAGQVWVWHGQANAPPTGSATNADWSDIFDAEYAQLGWSVSSAGDVNADGYSDIVMGGPGIDYSGRDGAGSARAAYGSAAGLNTDFTDWWDGSPIAGAAYGAAVCCAGDVNGDGFSDIAVGAPYYESPETGEGRAYLYYGGGTRGLARSPRMWHEDLATRLAPMGMSDSQNSFGVGARGRTPAGRGQVRLEVEAKPCGTPFDGTGTVTGDWSDTGAPSGQPGSVVDLAERVGGLSGSTAYHWRLRLVSDNHFFPRSPWLTMSWNAPTARDLRTDGPVSGTGDLPTVAFTGLQGVPNPFNPSTMFHYSLDRSQKVKLSLYDARGRLVRVLVDGVQELGDRTAYWDGRDHGGRRLASGVYLARLQTADRTRLTKVTLMK